MNTSFKTSIHKFVWLKTHYFDKHYVPLSLNHNSKSTLQVTFQINNGITLHKSLKLILELPGIGHTIIDIKIIYETKKVSTFITKIKLFLIAKICTSVTINLMT
jgi:hypothetical protein